MSRRSGIVVHRRDFSNPASIKDFTERRIDVEWETIQHKGMPVGVGP